jgi:hypothetical protein
VTAPLNTRFITSALRRVWMHSPDRKAAKAKANLRGTKAYLCSQCKRPYLKVEVDHVEPVGSPNGTDGWTGFITRLFCAADKLRVLCVKCHQARTKEARSK